MNRTSKSVASLLGSITAAFVCSLVLMVATQTTARSDHPRKVVFKRTTPTGPFDDICSRGFAGVTVEVKADQVTVEYYLDLRGSTWGPLTLSSDELQSLDALMAQWSAVPAVRWQPAGRYCAWEISFQRTDGTLVNFGWRDSDSSVPASAMEMIDWMKPREERLQAEGKERRGPR